MTKTRKLHAEMCFMHSNIVAVVVEWLACLPVTQKIGVCFYLESKAMPRVAELT